MTTEERVKTIENFGFTERQARFLVMVMRHAGICVPRQYAAFAGTAYGRRVNALFDRLVERRYATICGCVHNRARLYHVRHHALYHAIGEPHSRYRRPVAAASVSERLMLLDGMLTSPSTTWLATALEKAHGLTALCPSIPADALPHVTGNGPSRAVRLFPDRLPVGIDATGRVVLLYLVASVVTDDVRAFLQRHGDLLRAVPEWTVRLLFYKRVGALGAPFHEAFRAELASPLSPTVLGELRWYFEHCRQASQRRASLPSDARFRRIQQAFDAPRYRVLYRRWLEDGDPALNVVESGAIAEKLERGAGRLECVVLTHSYRHLTPLMSPRSTSQAVEEAGAGGDDVTQRETTGGAPWTR
jgi:hypothetical protein